ncbi:hypothetical protein TIFTF001_045407 [Ficus carica]|uniref:Uncharacterized protein n=1 Tax=Ficus carica TaxID=3494 RepID=A0AA88CHY1_FICCA|nr:hypothetical protein TIFTF001_045407 [Ficus carica]
MSSGDGEILAHKISLKGLATGWIHARQLAGQGAGNNGNDRGPSFVCAGVGLKLARLGLFHRNRGRGIRWMWLSC